MNRNQFFAVISPLLVLITMGPVFYFLKHLFPDHWRFAWILGLVIYWITWGFIYPVMVIGRERIRNLVKPRKPTVMLILLVLFPLAMTMLFKFVPGGIQYQKTNTQIILILLFSALGNGMFEEIYWRGVYMQLFPENILFRIIWPSIWFGLWHYIPGSLNPESSHVISLMIGAVFLGFYSSFIAWKTNNIWWSILIHVFGGILVIL